MNWLGDAGISPTCLWDTVGLEEQTHDSCATTPTTRQLDPLLLESRETDLLKTLESDIHGAERISEELRSPIRASGDVGPG